LHPDERDSLKDYLLSQYAGVLSEEQILRHIRDHVGLEIAEQQVDLVLEVAGEGASILDVGSGYGSFVLAARKKGLHAVGIETAPFEVGYARARLSEEVLGVDDEKVYLNGSGLELPLGSESFDAVTLWNVLEHVEDYKRLLKECIRVLKPEGFLFIVCPNYTALRREAHYQIFWPPFLSKRLGSLYLRLRGRNPAFFERNIFYRSNWGVLFTLKSHGLKIFDIRKSKIEKPDSIGNPKVRDAVAFLHRAHLSRILHVLLRLSFLNPFKNSVFVYARKERA
jgi:SAM-dependent methyltransferase